MRNADRGPTVYDRLPGNPVRLARRDGGDPPPTWPPPAGAVATIAVETPGVPWWGDYLRVVVTEPGEVCRGQVADTPHPSCGLAVGSVLAFDQRHVYQPGPEQPWFPTPTPAHSHAV